MRAELRRLHSPDVADLRAWLPEEQPAVLVQLMVGPAGGTGEESFEVTLCTPAWLAARAREEGAVDASHHTVVDEFDYETVERYFRRRVGACQGERWRDIATQVGRLGHWEFEDYQE